MLNILLRFYPLNTLNGGDETIDAVLQLILQDRHVTYREIETTLGISATVKKICSRWITNNLSQYRAASKYVYDFVTVDLRV